MSTPDTALPVSDAAEALRGRVRDMLLELGIGLAPDFGDDAPLISSGLLDSAGLFNLLLWIEGETGQPIDPSTVDIRARWDTVRDIVAFLSPGPADSRPGAGPARPVNAPVSPTGVRIRQAVDADREAVAAFQLRSWSRDRALNEACFDWKYRRAPASALTRVYLACKGDEIVGMRSLYGSLWEFGPDRTQVPALVADDLLVREDLRGTGLVSELMDHAFEDVAGGDATHLLNLSGGRVTVLGSLAMGWKRAGLAQPIGRETGTARRWRTARGMAARAPLAWRYARSPALYARAERQPFRSLDRLGSRVRAADGTTVTLRRDPPVAAMSALIEASAFDGRIRQVRDETFIAWRYSHPLHAYRFLTVGDARLEGYLVLKHSIASAVHDPRVKIVDFEAADPAVRRALLEVAVTQCGLVSLYAWSAAHTAADLRQLTELGFGPVDQALAVHGCPCWLVRPVAPGSDGDWRWGTMNLLEPRNWDMRMVYAMSG